VGSTVPAADGDPARGRHARQLVCTHAACLAIIERSALVTTAFTVLGKQVMHVRRNYRDRVDTEDGTPPSIRQLLSSAEPTDWDDPPYWARWTTDYDYLYILFTDRDYANPDPTRLTPVSAGKRFVLYHTNGQMGGPPKSQDWARPRLAPAGTSGPRRGRALRRRRSREQTIARLTPTTGRRDRRH